MIATARRPHPLVIGKKTGTATAGMVDTPVRACARGSQVALLCLRGRDRLLRTDRRVRPRRTAADLAAQGTDARDHPGRHARPLPAQHRLRSSRPLSPPATTRRSFEVNESGRLRSGSRLPSTVGYRHSPVPVRLAGIRWLPSPMFADQAATPLQGRIAPFPSHSSVPRGRLADSSGFCQPPDPHKEGTKDERHSTRR
jgi:hypothetical protein